MKNQNKVQWAIRLVLACMRMILKRRHQQPVWHLVLKAGNTSSDDVCPEFAVVTVGPTFTLRLVIGEAICNLLSMSEVRVEASVDRWGDRSFEEMYGVRFAELVVTRSGGWWFTASAKNADGDFETEWVSVKQVKAQLQHVAPGSTVGVGSGMQPVMEAFWSSQLDWATN